MSRPDNELLPGTRRALLHRIAIGQAEGRTPSMVGAVVREGRTVWTGARSMLAGHEPTADTQYRIGSLTKTFVAVLVMRLRDEGLLSLADPLEKYVAATAVGGLTVRGLLEHTSGLAARRVRCGRKSPMCSVCSRCGIRLGDGSTTPTSALRCSAGLSSGCADSHGATCCGGRCWSRWECRVPRCC